MAIDFQPSSSNNKSQGPAIDFQPLDFQPSSTSPVSAPSTVGGILGTTENTLKSLGRGATNLSTGFLTGLTQSGLNIGEAATKGFGSLAGGLAGVLGDQNVQQRIQGLTGNLVQQQERFKGAVANRNVLGQTAAQRGQTIPGQLGSLGANLAVLSAPGEAVAAGKTAMGALGEKLGLSRLAQAGKVGTALSYGASKALKSIPEAVSGYGYGLSQGQTPKQAETTAATFGVLSGMGEIVGDTWRAFKGGLGENISKAIGMSGRMSIGQAVNKIPQATSAFRTLDRLAPQIKVTTPDGIVKDFEPGKDGFWETGDALAKAKDIIYTQYDNLARQAGDLGSSFTQADFNSVINGLKDSVKDSTSSFKSKASSLIKDIQDNFGSANPRTGEVYFQNTPFTRIQNFIQKVNTDVNPLSDKAGATVSADTSQSMRDILDKKISQATGQGYQALRNEYANLKSVEGDMTNQLKKTMRGAGGAGFARWVEGYGAMDIILSALTARPAEAARGTLYVTLAAIMKKLRDPETYLKRAFNQLKGVNEAVSPLQRRIFGG